MNRRLWVVVVILFSLSSCDLTKILGTEEDDDDPATGVEMTSFVFEIENNPPLNSTIDGFVDQETQIVTVRLPLEVVNLEERLKATVELSPGASIDPDPMSARAYKNDVYYTVTAGNGATRTYVVQSQVASGAASAQIVDFRFLASNGENTELSSDSVATIGSDTVYVILPYDVLQEPSLFLEPSITVTDGASYTPTGPQNFKNPLSYTVTGADGRQETFTIQVSVDPDSI